MIIFKQVIRLSFTILFYIFSISYLPAQKGSNCPDDLVPQLSTNKMWGYVNLFGQWVINPVYTKVSPYVEGKAVVMKGLSYGVIDCEGNVILPAQYQKLTSFRNGVIWAQQKDGLWGLLNDRGRVLIEPQFTEINPIVDTELAWVRKSDAGWGLLDESKGTFICRPQYQIAQVMSENASLVQLHPPSFGVINHVNCTYLLPHTIAKVKKVAPQTIIFQQNKKWGVFNEWGKIVSNAEYDSVFAVKTVYNDLSRTYEPVLVIRKGRLSGLMNLNGKELLAPEYEDISDYSGGFFRIKKDGKYGFASRLGKVYIEPAYEEAGLFVSGQAIVKKNAKYGIIDVRNNFVMKPQYGFIGRHEENHYYAVKEKDKTGTEKVFLYSLDHKKLTDQAFDSVMLSDDALYTRVLENGQVRFYNVLSKNYSFEGTYDRAEPFADGFAKVEREGKWGIIDKKGQLIVPLQYEHVWPDKLANKPVFRTILNEKQGILDMKGKVILNNEYEMLVSASPVYIKAKKNGKYGVLKHDGSLVAEFIYDFISNQKESTSTPEWPAIIMKKGKYGLLNEKGEEIYQPRALSIEYVGEGNYSVKEKKNCGLLNSKCSNPYEPKYEIIRGFGDGLAAILRNGKWGYITKTGEEKIKPQFEEAGMFAEYMAPVKIKGLWGIIDVNGKLMVPAEYDRYVTLPDGTRNLYKNNKEYKLGKGGVLK